MKTACSLFLIATGLAACAGSEGALGQTETNAACSPADLVCALSGLDAPIALGATLPIDMAVTAQGSATPPLSLISGRPDVLAVDGHRITGAGRGVAALLALGPDGRVVDFLHLFVAQPDSLDLRRLTPEGLSTSPMAEKMQLLAGDELGVVATPALDTVRLLGEAEAVWAVEGDSILILDEGVPNQRRVVALEAGVSVLSVEALGLAAQLEMEVVL